MRLRIDQKFAGRKGRCPNCRNKMIIPAVDAPGVLLMPKEAAEAERGAPEAREEAPPRAEEPGAPPDTTQARESEVGVYVLPPEEYHRYTPPTIELLFQEKVREFITASPRWLMSLVAHIFIILIFLPLMISLTPAARVHRIPLQGRFIEAAQPPKMADLQVKDMNPPKMEDILTSTSPVETTTAMKPVVSDVAGAPGVGPPTPGDGTAGPPVIGFDVAGAGTFGSLGGSGRRFTVGSLGVGKSSVAFFGNEAKRGAESIVFIVDVSCTMGAKKENETASRFDRALTEIRSSVEKLTAGHRFNIIFFGSEPFRWQEHMVIASPEYKRQALDFIESMREFATKEQGTLVTPAVKQALVDSPEVIFLLTDGDFNDADDRTDLFKILQGKKVRVYPIGYGDRINEVGLQKLADQTNGRYTPAKM
jgi:hypothetical protein